MASPTKRLKRAKQELLYSQSKELAEVQKMLAEHKKKQDRILMLLEQVCSKHPESFAAAATSGTVYTPDKGL